MPPESAIALVDIAAIETEPEHVLRHAAARPAAELHAPRREMSPATSW